MGGKNCIIIASATVALLVSSPGILAAGDDPTTHPSPLPLSTVRPDHPRIWFNSDNVDILRQRWNDPAYSGVVSIYEGDNDALSLALEGLATQNASKCSSAAAQADATYRPEGDAYSGHIDPISLVFDWCYDYLDASEKADLISKIEYLRDRHKNDSNTGVRSFFRWHEIFQKSTFAYIGAVLAIEGEPGVSSELRQAQNVVQNLQELGDEVSGDGGYRTYFYQGNLQTLPVSHVELRHRPGLRVAKRVHQNLTSWATCNFLPSRNGFVRGPAR